MEKSFKTRELNFWQKLAQVYWVIPKSWQLDEFTINGDILTIRTKAGKNLSAPISELRIRIQKDKYDRHEVFVYHGEEKLTFKEIGYMLSDEEWQEILAILEAVPDNDVTKLGKVTDKIEKMTKAAKFFKDFI